MGRRGWPARLLLERAHRGLFLPYRVHYNSADRRDTLHETVSGIVCCFCCRMLRAGLRHRGSCAAAAVVAPPPPHPRPQLCGAASVGNVGATQAALDQGASVNCIGGATAEVPGSFGKWGFGITGNPTVAPAVVFPVSGLHSLAFGGNKWQ